MLLNLIGLGRLCASLSLMTQPHLFFPSVEFFMAFYNILSALTYFTFYYNYY